MHKMPFSVEDKHTVKVLRQQKLYGATKILKKFPNKKWTLSGVIVSDIAIFVLKRDVKLQLTNLSGVKTVLRLTLPAASNVILVAATGCGGSYKSVCTTTTGSRTWKSWASVSRRNGTVWTRKWLTTRSVNGAKRLTACVAAGRGHFEHSPWTLLHLFTYWLTCSEPC